MNLRVTVDAYEVPQVIGSFEALDVLGTVDGFNYGSTTTIETR